MWSTGESSNAASGRFDIAQVKWAMLTCRPRSSAPPCPLCGRWRWPSRGASRSHTAGPQCLPGINWFHVAGSVLTAAWLIDSWSVWTSSWPMGWTLHHQWQVTQFIYFYWPISLTLPLMTVVGRVILKHVGLIATTMMTTLREWVQPLPGG
jgi:hypothetical protein